MGPLTSEQSGAAVDRESVSGTGGRTRTRDLKAAKPASTQHASAKPDLTQVQGTSPARAGLARELLGVLQGIEAELGLVHRRARLLPAMTSRNGAGERARLVRDLAAGRPLRPMWVPVEPTPAAMELRVVDRLRRRLEGLPVQALYRDRLDELELELCMLDGFGRERLVRPLAARRFGTGASPVSGWTGAATLACLARRILAEVAPDPEPATVPATSFRPSRCLAGMMQAMANSVGLDARVVVDARLVAGAATGDRTVYVADRYFGAREARRLVAHEVLGHLLAAANGRCQPLRLLEWGTAQSFSDQEGVALCLEALSGALDADRLRTLAARVCATDLMHAGASFSDTGIHLARELGLGPEQAIAVTERAYRGGGVARDAAYLDGYLRVRQAVLAGETDLMELRAGRLSVAAIPEVRLLAQLGLFRTPPQRPNLALSFCSTSSGTTPVRLPPSDAASLMRLELT